MRTASKPNEKTACARMTTYSNKADGETYYFNIAALLNFHQFLDAIRAYSGQ
jgi:hypothetical protein